MHIIRRQSITLIHQRKPDSANLNEELQWIGSALGLFTERDKDRSCFRIFIELLKTASREESVTSDELAYHLGLSRATIVHHLKKLLDTRLVIQEKNGYTLRQRTLHEVINEIERDMQRTCEDIKEIAEIIDKKLKQ